MDQGWRQTHVTVLYVAGTGQWALPQLNHHLDHQPSTHLEK